MLNCYFGYMHIYTIPVCVYEGAAFFSIFYYMYRYNSRVVFLLCLIGNLEILDNMKFYC